jgi:hypothetical protein
MQALRAMVGGGHTPSGPGNKRRVLFVGNSLSSYKSGSLTAVFRDWGFHASEHISYGKTLAQIWAKGGWEARLRDGAYDVVVLQDDLPEYVFSPADAAKDEHWRLLLSRHETAAASFVQAIRAAGAAPLLLMAHEYCRLPKTTHRDVVLCHREAGRRLGVPVAAGAAAFQLAFTRLQIVADWSLPLLEPDREHPTLAGIYLHACAVAFALGVASEDLTPVALLEDDQADLLRCAAADAHAAWIDASREGEGEGD